MRVERLDLLSYGHLRDQSLDLSYPDGGLTVVVGPNEAGKSTAMRALVSLLFGIDRRTLDDHGFGRESLRVGARIRSNDGSVLEVVRQGFARMPLVDLEGRPVDEAALQSVLGTVDRALYKALFCVDHDELHEHSEDLLVAEGEIGQLVFGASLGATVLSRVLSGLDGRADGLFKARGSSQKVAKVLARHRELTSEARKHRVRSRDWERAETELSSLSREVERLRARVAELQANNGWLALLRSAMPLLAKRSNLIGQLTGIEAAGLIQSMQWAERVQAAWSDLGKATEDSDRAAVTRDRLKNEIDGLDVSELLLQVADRVDELLRGTGRYRKDKLDLPGLEVKFDASRKREGQLLLRSGLTTEQSRAITDAQTAEVEELAKRRTSIDQQLSSARRELEELDDEIRDLSADIDGLPEPLDVETLARRLEVARPSLDEERRLHVAQAELEAVRTDAELAARRLGLEGRSHEEIEALRVPSSDALAAHREAKAALETKLSTFDEHLARLDQQRDELEARRTEILADPSVPEPEEVASARARRDEGWSLVRAAWREGSADQSLVIAWTGGADLVEAYPDAVGAADGAADRRYDRAEQLTNLEAISTDLTRAAEERDRVRGEREAIEGQFAELDKLWTEAWAVVGLDAPSLGQAGPWLDDLRDLQHLVADYRKASLQVAAQQQNVGTQIDVLRAELKAVGEQPDEGSLAQLAEQAAEVVRAARAQAEARREAAQSLAIAQRSRPRRVNAVDAAAAAHARWLKEWTHAVAPLGMEPGSSTNAATQAISLLREVRSEWQEADSLDERIIGLRRDVAAYSSQVNALLAELPDIAQDLEPDAALAVIKPLLEMTRGNANKRTALRGQLEEAERQMEAAKSAISTSETTLQRLRSEAQLAADVNLSDEAARVTEASAVRDAFREVEGTLIAQGAGHSLEEIVAGAEKFESNGDLVSAAKEALEAEIRDAEDLLAQANQELGDARAILRAMSGSGDAAGLEQEAELELAQLADHVHEYARLALGGELLRRVVADYGQRHQGPIVARASDTFARLTDGAFSELVVDISGDGQVLLAKRQNGEFLRVAQLSEGTLDQLYLALRLAGIWHHLDNSDESLPVVLDDLLINFDDSRARAAIEVLAELGQRTQVLLFTHHDHVCEMACDLLNASCVSVARLSARSHDTPLAVGAAVDPAAARSTPARRSGQGYEGAVVEVLRGSRMPLGKAEILTRISIPDNAWAQTIRALIDRGAVVQEGAKRGARYSLPDG
jgi:uncharacterized protein YhaN